jgi:hypothetical protein
MHDRPLKCTRALALRLSFQVPHQTFSSSSAFRTSYRAGLYQRNSGVAVGHLAGSEWRPVDDDDLGADLIAAESLLVP